MNERGGLKLKDGQRKVEIIEYDDRTQPPEAIKAVERLATVDKADWISGVYATGFNLATAPTFDKYKYPQVSVACITDQAPALVKKYPNFFMFNASTTDYAKGAIGVLKKLKDSGQIGNKVAVVNVGDDFGIELANAGRRCSRRTASTSSMTSPTRSARRTTRRSSKAAKAANRMRSLPGRIRLIRSVSPIRQKSKPIGQSLLLRDRLRFQGFSQKNGPAAENVLGASGIADSPEIRAFYKSTRRSPASMPTMPAARFTTRCSKC